jgi:hypothetical protein
LVRGENNMRAPDVTEADIAKWDLMIKDEGGTDDAIKRELSYASYWIRDKIADLSLDKRRLDEIDFAFGQRVCATSEWQYKPYEREEGGLYGDFELGGLKINRRHYIQNIWMLAEWVMDRCRLGIFDKPGEELAMSLTLEFSANFLQMRKAIRDANADAESQVNSN